MSPVAFILAFAITAPSFAPAQEGSYEGPFVARAEGPSGAGQEPPPGPGRPPGPGLVTPVTGDRIAWFGTWDGGLAEARRTNRPILLVSAAPHCHNVPGVW